MTNHSNGPAGADSSLRTLQIIYLAMFSGILTIAMVFLLVPRPGSGPSGETVPLVLSLVHGGLLLLGLPGVLLVFGTLMNTARKAEGPGAMQKLQAAYLVRLAFVEGVAMFGLVTLYLTGREVLAARPVFWLNIVSLFLYLTMLSATFPTRERIDYQLRSR